MMRYHEKFEDGREVELIDMTLANRDGDLWLIDVHFLVDEAIVTKRVELIWSETDNLPPVGLASR